MIDNHMTNTAASLHHRAGRQQAGCSPSLTRDEVLARAQRLGYLVTPYPCSPLAETYLQWCHDHRRPAVVLFPYRRNAAAIIYRLPCPNAVLTDIATERIRHRAKNALLSPSPAKQYLVIAPNGGEIRGLRPEMAEQVAFWIADAAWDLVAGEGG
jgi:hypothetical protein